MVKMTSAYANKLLKQLSEDKEYWVNKERSSCVYTAAVGETPVVPEYDYTEVSAVIAGIDEKMCRIKHAINLANATNTVSADSGELTIDAVLVRMAQLNQRKSFLDYLRKQQPKTRKEAAYGARNAAPEYQYINYDLEQIKAEYETVSAQIMNLQIALDKYNQTFEFEVEI